MGFLYPNALVIEHLPLHIIVALSRNGGADVKHKEFK